MGSFVPLCLPITLCTVIDDGDGVGGTVTEPQAKCDDKVARKLGKESWRCKYAHILMCNVSVVVMLVVHGQI